MAQAVCPIRSVQRSSRPDGFDGYYAPLALLFGIATHMSFPLKFNKLGNTELVATKALSFRYFTGQGGTVFAREFSRDIEEIPWARLARVEDD